MSFAPIPPPPAPPAEPRPRRFSRTQKAVIAAGLAAGLALGGAGISYAASSGSSSTTTPPKPSTPSTPSTPNAPFKPGHGPRGFGPGPFGLGFGGGGRVVHGQVTERTGNGTYQTIAFQVGTVDPNGVSSTSLSVTSTDKFHTTYVVTPATVVDAQRDGISDVKAGDQVQVTAKVSGSTQTAVRVIDLTQTKNSRKSFGFGPPAGKPANPSGSARTAVASAF